MTTTNLCLFPTGVYFYSHYLYSWKISRAGNFGTMSWPSRWSLSLLLDTMTSRAGGLYGGIQFSGKSLPPSSQQFASSSASSTPQAPSPKLAAVQASVVQQTDNDTRNQVAPESTAVAAKPSAGISICPP